VEGKVNKRAALAISVVAISFLAFYSARPQEKLKALMIYGNGFIFGALEPDGWTGDTENAARFQVNIVFYPKGREWNSPGPSIRVRVNDKTDENTAEDLANDMEGYRKKYPLVQFRDIEVAHPQYRCFPKLFFVENDFYEYVTYINPGGSYWYSFSVALSVPKGPAEPEVLEAYRKVIGSLQAISGVFEMADRTEANEAEFDKALKSADDNMKSKKGKLYDVSFGRHLGPLLAQSMMSCTKDIPESAGVKPFVVLVQVGKTGEAERILVRPETQVALCVKRQIPASDHPKPPGPSWWVKVEVSVVLKDAPSVPAPKLGVAVTDFDAVRRYAYWSGFKPGTSVSFRYSRQWRNEQEECLRVFTVKAVSPESALLEWTDYKASETAGPVGPPTGVMRLEFLAADDEFQGWDLFGVRLGYNVFHALRNPAAKVLDEVREEVTVGDRRIPARRTAVRFGSGVSETTLTVWTSDEVPGRVVKFVRELKGPEAVREEAAAVACEILAAEPAAVAALRAGRKPAPIEVPAPIYVAVRLKLVDDYGVALREFADARNEIRASLLKLANTEPSKLKKTIAPFRDRLRDLAKQLSGDIGLAEKEAGAAEFSKLKRLTDVSTKLASLFVKEADVTLGFLGAIQGGHADPELLNSLNADKDRLKKETTAAVEDFKREIFRLEGVKIILVR
jgi:hypothetical protein